MRFHLKIKPRPQSYKDFLQFLAPRWYENIYLDDETSFVKAAKMLTKVAPIQVHYSTPYCHFQNNSENYIKHFKKTFLNPLPHGVLASFCLTAGGLLRPPEEDDISREKIILMT